jgi:hypothetical protein
MYAMFLAVSYWYMFVEVIVWLIGFSDIWLCIILFGLASRLFGYDIEEPVPPPPEEEEFCSSSLEEFSLAEVVARGGKTYCVK